MLIYYNLVLIKAQFLRIAITTLPVCSSGSLLADFGAILGTSTANITVERAKSHVHMFATDASKGFHTDSVCEHANCDNRCCSECEHYCKHDHLANESRIKNAIENQIIFSGISLCSVYLVSLQFPEWPCKIRYEVRYQSPDALYSNTKPFDNFRNECEYLMLLTLCTIDKWSQ